MTLLAAALDMFKAATPQRIPLSPQMWSGPQAGGSLFGAGQTQAQLSAYGAVGWLFAVVNRIAEGMAGVHWQLYQTGGRERREIEKHPLLDLWKSLNPFMTQYEFIEASQQHFELAGESWWVLLRTGRGQIAEMWPVRPDRMSPVVDTKEFIKGYLYRIGSESVPLPVEDVIFTRRPNPLDPYRGIGTVQTIIADLEGERAASLWNRNFFYNSAEPGGIIQFEHELTDQAWQEFQMRWREQHQGIANAHRVAVLERGKWVDRKYTQRDMQFRELRDLNRDIILGAFGMPKHLLGITEDINRANAEAGEVIFGRWVLRPRLERLRQSLNERLAPQFGPGLEFDFVDPTPANRELERVEAVDGYRYGVLTLNEARRRIGEDDLPGGESLYAPAPVTPAEVAEHVGEARALPPVIERAFELPEPVQANEQRMAAAWAKRLRSEADALIAFLEQFKALPVAVTKIELTDLAGYDWDWWDRYQTEVIAELTEGFLVAFVAAAPELGPTAGHTLAVEYARSRGARLLRLDGDVSIAEQTRRRVQGLVAETIANGDSLQTLQRNLRNDLAFSRERAELVARTETATALGQGEKYAAMGQGREEKHWVTQGDDHVEDNCRRNAGVGWIAITGQFPTGVDTIPQHPRCRCVVRYRHKPVAESLVPAVLSEVHCPGCQRRLPVNNLAGKADVYCKRCDQTYGVGFAGSS